MKYLQRAPRPELRDTVESLWYQEAPADLASEEPTLVVPGSGLELIVCFGDPFEHLENGVAERLPAIRMTGQRTRRVKARATGSTGMVIARCYPWAAPALLRPFGAEPIDLVDDYIEASGGNALLERIHTAHTAEDRLTLVETHLLHHLADLPPDPLVVTAIEQINAAWGSIPVQSLADEHSISRRQLHRRFLRSVGTGPKRFARLVRYQKALGCLRMGSSFDEVVGHCRYVDQAHLIGELKHFTGLAPGAVARRAATPLMRFYNSRHLQRLHNTAYL